MTEKQDIESFKAQFEFWDNWTSARYDRVRSPHTEKYISQSGWPFSGKMKKNPNYNPDAKGICRYNPATDEWSALDADQN